MAFLVVTRNGAGRGRLPTFPSLPPVSFARHARRPRRRGVRGTAARLAIGPRRRPALPATAARPSGTAGPAAPAARRPPRRFPAARRRSRTHGTRAAVPANGPGGPGGNAPGVGLPTSAALLDYGIRLLIIGLAAWLGARWLSAPMRRLQSASRTLGQSLARNEAPPQVDERAGTVEVRETAHVFNEMSRQLSEQVHSRALLVAAISHDLRTPLTRIRMRLEASEDDPLTARSIADIHEMDDLIESALEVFRGTGAA